MRTDDDRDKLQIILKHSLLEFGFQSQTYLFQNKKLVPGITISMIYALFCVLPTSLQALGCLDDIPTKNLIIHLHTLTCLGFWWPYLHTDVIQAWDFIHGRDVTMYHNAMYRLSINVVNAVDRYVKRNMSFGKFVDHPNIRRLLELTTHTLPLYLHLHFVCEMVFDSAHHPLKFLLSRNNTSNSHLNSVQDILIKDWMKQILVLLEIVQG